MNYTKNQPDTTDLVYILRWNMKSIVCPGGVCLVVGDVKSWLACASKNFKTCRDLPRATMRGLRSRFCVRVRQFLKERNTAAFDLDVALVG